MNNFSERLHDIVSLDVSLEYGSPVKLIEYFMVITMIYQCEGFLAIYEATSKKGKTISIWAATWQNQQSDCAPSVDSDQPGHPPSMIRVFTVRSMGSYADSEDWSDWADAQAYLSLCWAHGHFVGFVMSWLIKLSNKISDQTICGDNAYIEDICSVRSNFISPNKHPQQYFHEWLFWRSWVE